MAENRDLEGKPSLAQLSTMARRLVADLASNFYELGRLLSLVNDGELFLEAGYSSLGNYAHDELGLSRSTSYRTMAMYRHFSPEVAKRYGVSKLEAGLAYLRATPADERPGDLLAARLRIRGKKGRFVRRTFYEATVDEVREARDLVVAGNRGRKVSAKARRGATRLSGELPAAPSRLARGDRIRMQRDEDTGKYFATFVAIPMDDLPNYIEFLKSFREELGL